MQLPGGTALQPGRQARTAWQARRRHPSVSTAPFLPPAPLAPPPPGPPIHHFDLYRLEQRYDLARLDLAASFAQAVCLVEWPERLAGAPVQPVEPLDVHISILDAAEQAQLQERLQQQRAAQHGSGDGGAAAAGAAGGEEDEEELGSSSSDEEGSGDHRWRRIQLLPSGERWQPRLQLLRRYLRVEGAQAGCYIEGEPS